MFKIKLLILLLISIFQINCASKINQNNNFNVEYISESYEGLLLKNKLEANLKGFNIYNQRSNLTINGSINHEFDTYITNIDNTSQREKVTTNVDIRVYDKNLECIVYKYNENISQFYIYSSGTYFLSNKKAQEKITFDNTNILAIQFINSIPTNISNCAE
tara:strand:+ start:196 stop:678 length:483 start_codon:yes stop_codon:yes gene_type:complete